MDIIARLFTILSDSLDHAEVSYNFLQVLQCQKGILEPEANLSLLYHCYRPTAAHLVCLHGTVKSNITLFQQRVRRTALFEWVLWLFHENVLPLAGHGLRSTTV